MAALPKTDTLVDLIDSAVEAALSSPPRGHLGASQIGHECERALWYGFRWAFTQPRFNGRLLRLFDRGHEEEYRFIRWLKLAGVTVNAVNAQGDQYSFSAPETGHHFAGSMDGAALNIPGAEKAWHVLEFKTTNDKGYKALVKEGVEKAKPLHYAQMQVYMHWTDMKRALYLSVNKNDDCLYAERIAYDKTKALRLIDKATRIVSAQNPPAGISDKPDWYACKFCDYHALCHGRVEDNGGLGPQALPDVHCRTCLHATPELTPDSNGNARWSCARWQCDIPEHGQREGCPEHRYIPGLIPWAAVVDSTDDFDVIYELSGESHQPFVNGVNKPSPEVPALTSKELKAAHPALIGDAGVEAIRETFDAEFVEDEFDDVPF